MEDVEKLYFSLVSHTHVFKRHVRHHVGHGWVERAYKPQASTGKNQMRHDCHYSKITRDQKAGINVRKQASRGWTVSPIVVTSTLYFVDYLTARRDLWNISLARAKASWIPNFDCHRIEHHLLAIYIRSPFSGRPCRICRKSNFGARPCCESNIRLPHSHVRWQTEVYWDSLFQEHGSDRIAEPPADTM